MSRILTPQEIKPRRPDSLADDAVAREPVSPCYTLFSPVMFKKTGNFSFSWKDLWSIFFQVLSTFPSVMVFSLRYKTCDHFSTKQGCFFNVSGTLDLVTGGNSKRLQEQQLRSSPLLFGQSCSRPQPKSRPAIAAFIQ
jgi:hypothetical protein